MIIKQKSGDGKAKLDNFIKEASKNKVAAVGWFPDNKYPVDDKGNGGEYVAEVAATQEFGSASRKIPPRPFMRPTMKTKKKRWSALANIFSKRMLKGEMTIEQMLEQISLVAEGDFRNAIKQVTSPALAPSTIRGRLSRLKNKTVTATLTKPLIYTAVMINSLTRVIKKK